MSLETLYKCPLIHNSHAHNARRPSLGSLTGVVWTVVVRFWYIIKSALNANTSIDKYVCISCNLDNEAKKPWLLQHKPDPPPEYHGLHVVQHTLALAIDSSVPSETELTTENRLDRLEKKFENHEKVMQERMEEMSRLLQQVLAGRVQSSSS